MQSVIAPGATIGVLGSGQLGRMFAIAARRMGYRVHTYSPEGDTPTGQVADREWRGDYADLDLVRHFAQEVEVITFEFENVPSSTTAAAAECAPVRPRGEVLHITQNRLREKHFLRDNGFPLPAFAPVRTREDLDRAAREVGLPGVLKTAGWGYDGKGQVRVETEAALEDAFAGLAGAEAIYESFVDFAHEGSVVAARDLHGNFTHFGLFENIHQRHILDLTLSPGRLPTALEKEAVAIARGILEALDVVGVLCVEFFITRQGTLLVNELAPRPHNSGHVTVDAHLTSQFEQQLRAVCGLPLGGTQRLRPAAMANLLGDLWQPPAPDYPALCAFPDVKLHLYGKAEARPGRKMGHLTALADTAEDALEMVMQARAAFAGKGAQLPPRPSSATRHPGTCP